MVNAHTSRSIRTEDLGGGVLLAYLHTDEHGLFGRDAAAEFAAFVAAIDRDPRWRAVVLTGTHPTRFISHADLAWLQQDGSAVPPLNRRVMGVVVRLARVLNTNRATRFMTAKTPMTGAIQLDEMHRTLDRMSTGQTIYVAALNGSALGLGAEIAWACDVRLMAEGDHMIGHLEVLLGFAPGAGGTQRLSALVGPHKARLLILEGAPLIGPDAVRLGVVDAQVPADELIETAVLQARRLASRPPRAIGAVKRAVAAGVTRGQRAGLRAERTEFLASLPQREAQQIMLDYLAETSRDGELPIYRAGGYAEALVRGRATGTPESVAPGAPRRG
ncbi:enoyl-CoA hydratase/isomerase family protein [Gordonia sp. TBRC 11910]|uniref:Enoyl-CoA hydratase/isomerase family protein n=1 Tax=Gordonia asplenii TaxID=2725283 RepID=A0A848L0Y5_9ACTN|nr:enoyl-CoA hydratase/isomerase family protein [Gordonia asplenii]NMO02735.1 enoyl-CoA hydratase/isomerase family protein [Gordonia asplenii]